MDAIVDTTTSAARTFSRRPHSEGRLVDPPPLVQKCWGKDAEGSQAFWAMPSPVSDPSHELETLRTAWRELAEIVANSPIPEVPELFQMPPAPTRRVLGRVHKVGPAPFVFVDDFADQSE